MSELTREQVEFLKIVESFMHDKVYHMPEDVAACEQADHPASERAGGQAAGVSTGLVAHKMSACERLYQMAQQHHLAAAVYEQIRSNAIAKQPEYGQLFAVWKRTAIRDVMLQMQRAEGFLDVYEKLCNADVKPLVVKGIICRNLYSKPDYRISGDEDILIRREDFAVCDEILAAEGFHREVPDQNNLPYEIPYLHPQTGVYIEMHLHLFPEESGAYGHLNEEFRLVHENCVCQEIQGKKVWTLCPTEHLFYLICHSFKHFLHSGFGIRQVCDMVMMAEKYGEQIDWSSIQEKLARLNMEKYWKGLVQIGVQYLGFDLDKAAYPAKLREESVDARPLLFDLMDSGIFGDSSMERKHSSNMTLAAAAGGKANTAASLGASLFPEMAYMKTNFKWLEKYPWLLPAAYAVRIWRYLKTSNDRNDEGKNSVQIGAGRVELLKKYGIIE